jgi:hypothetical protein
MSSGDEGEIYDCLFISYVIYSPLLISLPPSVGGLIMKGFSVFRKFLLISIVAVCVPLFTVALAVNAGATESGGGAYPNGAEDFMSGALPPPGTYLLYYLNYYTASSFKDKNGDDLIPDFKVNAVANVFRLVHVTKYQILGASWGVQALLPVVHLDVKFPGASDDRWGNGDLIVDPFLLGWHSKNLHVTAGIDIYIPIGTYDQNRLANAGRNYWTFEPVIGATYLSDNGLEVSGKFMYDFNTENNDTNYRSGQEFHFDYTLGYHMDKNLALGLGGYCYWQVSDDELNGVTVGPDGFKGRVYAVGPQVQYNYKNMSLALKWQREFGAEYRPEGNNFWLKFMWAF